MTERDEILYTDLTDEERAALDDAVALLVRESAIAAAQAIRARVDNDDLTPTGYDNFGAPLYGWQTDGRT